MPTGQDDGLSLGAFLLDQSKLFFGLFSTDYICQEVFRSLQLLLIGVALVKINKQLNASSTQIARNDVEQWLWHTIHSSIVASRPVYFIFVLSL